ncbi:2-succinyl-5-enolpyruvyl-6-hydroxy-3-cyclohexene-1-carboxylic-acid synthase [Arsenicibacter rosenii]|uniref:2-succinyl-5-enolpyruvyl-6-hydroxy-3-cyclohexene-1-carboxylate synthase n=1 Tax=Arsenicibacter rosenii TaxID=1750698 RepID=A0A1S2VRP0_9BACT|nr:2-succinyl-5-enolpyruvyl-6-hydroxy-3-cyclohexene-1-carboxylic-acid synthase [Arsenicibacter rosenii]OIN60936.1 2-succinyl-5-enolpyruvyl-6-hydroxy-3-cyclohexene-1-carboxylic-acid synthase [Arsenicibacter rosenii]
MPILQPIVNIAELLSRKGMTDVIVSPGSRSAPLTLAVVRHPGLQVRVVPDERSAGFIALGLAQQQQRPVGVICTSGSAVYNLAPAVAEAYFQEIPLLLLTADRPREWVHQQDGQTMFQAGIFGQHVKRSYELPADYDHPDSRWFIERSLNEAYNLTVSGARGPVHINIPLREPFYPKPDERFRYEPVRIIDTLPTEPSLKTEDWHRIQAVWEGTGKKLIAVGQMPDDPVLIGWLRKLSDEFQVPVVGEIVSNLARNGQFITFADTFLAVPDEAFKRSLQPDLLITLGLSFLTRNLKTFLRQFPASQHWHIAPVADRVTDPFRTLTTQIPMEPAAFFSKLFSDLDYQRFLQGDEEDDTDGFLERWQQADRKAGRVIRKSLAGDTLTDFRATAMVLDALPAGSELHLSNSMPVRYATLCGLDERQAVAVRANRGVSGIDGCLSTAVGAALGTDRLVTLFIGDVAFFYDRNGLWNNYLPANLRMVLFNNHGGHIFRMIDGPGQQPELEAFFEVAQPLTAERTAADAGIGYRVCTTLAEVKAALPDFFDPSATVQLLEIKTDKYLNQEEFAAYKAAVRSM